MRSRQVLEELKARTDPADLPGMARFGINTDSALGGIRVPELRNMAKRLGRDHALALELWASGIHEARLLATMVDVPTAVTEEQMERWAVDFDSWDIVDQCCGNLFDKTPYAHAMAARWSSREEEFVKRAGFVLMASLAVHDTNAPDVSFEDFLPLIEREAQDRRNFVRKSVNWALRQIGKRNLALNAKAVAAARRIRDASHGGRNWVAADALRELTSPAVTERLQAAGASTPDA